MVEHRSHVRKASMGANGKKKEPGGKNSRTNTYSASQPGYHTALSATAAFTKAIQARSALNSNGRKKRTWRIAHVHWAFAPTIGGVETHLATLMPELARQGHSVSLLTSTAEGIAKQETYHHASVYRSDYMSLELFLEKRAETMRPEIHDMFARYIAAVKPHIIHAHNLNYFSDVHAQELSKLCEQKRIALVLSAHNAWSDLQFVKLSRNIAWDHIIAVSHFVKRELVGVGCNGRAITVIHHGIDTEKFSPRVAVQAVVQRFPQLRGCQVVFHPARMGLAKGNDVVIKAFRLVRQAFPNAMLVLAGSKRIIDWEQRQQKSILYLTELLNQFKLMSHTIIDTFSIDEMPAMYALSDVIVYPSTAPEPFGLTLLEASATGKPIIVSNIGGMPEIIHDGTNGFLVPVHDPEILAARIMLLLSEPELRERIGITAWAMAQAYYNKERMTRDHELVYGRILDHGTENTSEGHFGYRNLESNAMVEAYYAQRW